METRYAIKYKTIENMCSLQKLQVGLLVSCAFTEYTLYKLLISLKTSHLDIQKYL